MLHCRLPVCDVPFEHPSLSRYHAVLQYKVQSSPEKPSGFYLFDLDSTHGTLHNKRKCFPKTFYRLRVGHMLKFGGSTRTVILQGPEEDQEEESDLSITELKTLAAEKAKKKAEEEAERSRKLEEAEQEEESGRSKGISWGMEDDAMEEEFPDMEKNPFAELANNESLYIEDPKKCLKNWFDREGYDLDYKVEEKGFAEFHCRVELPVDGQPNFAEAQVKGKKKEAVIQAALEACRILDRLGLLKQSQQTRLERKVKKWEDDDFYDSDEDEFLDRTGDIALKRKKRMKMAGMAKDTIETYESLKKKYEDIEKEQQEVEVELKKVQERNSRAEKMSDQNDLDRYLAELKKGAQVDKGSVTKLKVKLNQLSIEKERMVKLINIAKPINMPELKSDQTNSTKPKSGIMIGKIRSKGFVGKIKNVTKDSLSKPIVVPAERTRVLEAFLQEDEAKSKKMKLTDDDTDDDMVKPISYEINKPTEKERKDRIGDTSANIKPKVTSDRKLGPTVPDHIKEALAKSPEETKAEEKPKEEASPARASTEQIESGQEQEMVTEDVSEESDAVKRKRGDRGSKRRAKLEESSGSVSKEKEEFYKVGMDSKYDVWVPPENQSGDGKTSLNDKLGY